jgi:pimeloyl-ACP methyl ester carboxylesterase
MQSKVAHLLDRSVRYLESGGGHPLILLHAFPLSADQWLPQLHRLPPGWRGLAPDLRGFRGGSFAFPHTGLDSMTLDQHANDVLEFMTHLEIDRAVVAGVSMGGYIAFAMLRRAPRRLAGLVLSNTRATPDSADGLAARDRMVALAEREGAIGVAREMVAKLLGATSRACQPDLADVVRQMIQLNPTDAIVAAVRAMKHRPDSTSLLSGIGCPTLVVTGEEDALISGEDAKAMHDAIHGSRLVAIPRAGHLPNLEAPLAFNDALSAFLREIPRAAFVDPAL